MGDSGGQVVKLVPSFVDPGIGLSFAERCAAGPVERTENAVSMERGAFIFIAKLDTRRVGDLHLFGNVLACLQDFTP